MIITPIIFDTNEKQTDEKKTNTKTDNNKKQIDVPEKYVEPDETKKENTDIITFYTDIKKIPHIQTNTYKSYFKQCPPVYHTTLLKIYTELLTHVSFEELEKASQHHKIFTLCSKYLDKEW